MKKLSFIVFSFVLIFLFLLKVNAECTYQERLDLLKDAKKIDIFFELAEEKEKINAVNPNTGEASIIEITNEYFNMNFANISENVKVKVINVDTNESFVVNKNNLVNGLYSFRISNVSDIVSYKIEYYSNLNNCTGDKLSYTKTLKKPKLNSVYHYMICSDELVSDSKYCKRVIDIDFNKTDLEIIEYLKKVIDESREDNKVVEPSKNFMDILKDYWYIPTAIGVVLIGIIFTLIIKKRGELR